MWRAVVAVVMLALSAPAHAQQFPFAVTDYSAGAGSNPAVGTSPVTLAAPVPTAPAGAVTSATRSWVFIALVSTGTVSCTFDGTTPTLNGATNFTLTYPGGPVTALVFQRPGYVPQGPIQCIGSAAGLNVTLKVGVVGQ
jgi:hypothetical protein